MKKRVVMAAVALLGIFGLGRAVIYVAERSVPRAPRSSSLMPDMVPPTMDMRSGSGLNPGPIMAPPRAVSDKISLENPLMSPDGKFIAFHIVESFERSGFGSRSRAAVVSAASNGILVRTSPVSNPPELSWSAPGQPLRLNLDGVPHELKNGAGKWSLVPAGEKLGSEAPGWILKRNPYPSQEIALPRADLNVWFMLKPSGRGDLLAAAPSDESQVWLPASISQNKIAGATEFAAPPLQSRAPRQLAAIFYPDPSERKAVEATLEAWDLDARKLLFRRTFPDRVSTLAWTRDGRTVLVGGTPRAQKRTDPDGVTVFNGKDVKNRDLPVKYVSHGVDIYDVSSGKARTLLNIDGLEKEVATSDDSRYFLTVENTWKGGRSGQGRLAIRVLPSGAIVCQFQRDKRIEARPKFGGPGASQLIWSSQDTIFVQPWKASQTPRKLAPKRFKIQKVRFQIE